MERQLLGDLAERDLARAAEVGELGLDAGELRAHVFVHRPEPGLDERLLRLEVGLRGLGLSPQDLTVEHC